LLYNMGMCADRLRADQDAIRYFERYLAAAPDAPNREDVELRLEALRSASGSTALIATTLAPSDADDALELREDAPEPLPHDNTPGVVLIATGGGVALVGIGLLIASAVDTATVENAEGVTFASVRGAYERVPALSGAGWAALALGVGGAAIGTVLLLTTPARERLALRIGPGSLLFEGTF
jgi:tetratricopeptide (TPR) repeat protein